MIIAVMTSCSTMTGRQAVQTASDVSAALISGDLDALTGSSGTPFLFESEILYAPAQLSALWKGLAASGYDFDVTGDITVITPDTESWRRFSSSREVEVWFQRHAPEKAVLVFLPTKDGRLVFIIDKDLRSSKSIRGLNVEQE